MRKLARKQNRQFTKNIKKLRKQYLGNNRGISEALRECAAAGRQLADSQRKQDAAHLKGLAACYELWIRTYRKKEIWDQLAKLVEFDSDKRTSAKLINCVLKRELKVKAPYASKLAAVIQYAIFEGTSGDDLEKFIKHQGGINGCVRAWRDLISPTAKNEAEQETHFKGFLLSDSVRRLVEKQEALARKMPGYQFTLTFEGRVGKKLWLIEAAKVEAERRKYEESETENHQIDDEPEEIDQLIKDATLPIDGENDGDWQ